jgi:hypothetical protein
MARSYRSIARGGRRSRRVRSRKNRRSRYRRSRLHRGGGEDPVGMKTMESNGETAETFVSRRLS